MADNRGIAYIENGIHVYRASAIGMCVRALAASLLGYDEGRYERTQTIMENAASQGDLLEGHVLERLGEQGFVISQRQLMTETRVIPGAVVRGHVDGLATSGPGVVVNAGVEVKTMSKDRYAKWKSSDGDLLGEFRSYGWQVSAYWEGMERLLNTAIGSYVYAVIDRNSGELDVRVLTEPPVSWRDIKRKIIKVEGFVITDDLPDCNVTDGGERYFCPFVFLHDEDVSGEDDQGPIDDLTAAVVSGLAGRYWELSEAVKAGKAAEEERKPVSKELMKHVPKGARVSAGGFKVLGSGGSFGKVDWNAVAEDLGMTVKEAKGKYEKRVEYEYPRVTKEYI
jgi:hypothetical protein